MTKTNNILLKLFVLLVLGVGWNCDAWAQGIGYKVIINGDNSYQVTANASILNGSSNATVGNNGYLDITDAAAANWYSDNRSININCTDKFVWGPVLDTATKTITYTIKQPVDVNASANTPLTTEGWYQFQVVDYNGVNKLGTVNNTSAHKSQNIYLTNADIVHRQNGSNWYSVKFSGVAKQNSEAQTFFYLRPSGNNPRVQVSNGLYIKDNCCAATTIQDFAPFAPINALGGIYSVKRWAVWDDNSQASTERPYMGASGQIINYHVRAVKVDPTEMYDVYRVNIPGVTNSGELGNYAHVTCNNSKLAGAAIAYQGGYFFFEKGYTPTAADFTCNVSAINDNMKIVISRPDAEGIRTITFRELDHLATDPWTVRTPNGYNVIYQGDEYRGGDLIYVRPNSAPRAVDLEITDAEGNDGALASKFVWGPIIDTRAKTVSYEVRNRATELTSGWYQMQLTMPEANILSLRSKIKDEEGNINTAANTLYLAPAIYDINPSKQFKITGVPKYADESSTYVYINTSGGTLRVTNPRTGAELSGNYTFADGLLSVTNWAVDETPHPLEGPNVGSGSTTYRFNLNAVNEEVFDVYKVAFAGDIAAVQAVTINSSAARGITTVNNGGYVIMRKGSNAPMIADFSVAKGNGNIVNCEAGPEVNGVIPVTLTISEDTEPWKVKINGGYKVRYKNNATEYADDSYIDIPAGTVPSHVDFKTTCTDKFVWGPVIDSENSTVTFEIRELPATLETGWYQMMLIEDPNNGNAQHRPTAANVNQRIANVSGNINTQSNYIYVTPFYNLATNWLGKMTGIPTYGDEPVTYFYIEKNGNNLSVQSPNGLYTSGSRLDGTNANKQTFTNYDFNNGILRVKGWTAPGHWNSTNCSGTEGPNVANGGDEYYQSQYLTKIDVNTKYSVYKVELPSGVLSVKYVGTDNHGSRSVYNNGYFFLTKDVTPTKEDFKLDGNVAINSISISGANVITFTADVPAYDNMIIHRQARYYDFLEDEANRPVYGFIKDGEGMNTRVGKNSETIVEQNTAIFEIPIYLKRGTLFTSYMPTDQVLRYQRWYNWDTDGQVDPLVLRTLPDWTGRTAKANGDLTGSAFGGFKGSPVFSLPLIGDGTPGDQYREYNVGMDLASFDDYATIGTNIKEPTLAMRVIYQVRDAKIIAKAIKDSTAHQNFFETHNISFPNIKHGTHDDKTISNLLPFDMDLNNYWMFNSPTGEGNNDLLQLMDGNSGASLRIELGDHSEGCNLRDVMLLPSSASTASGNISRTSFNTGHFIIFKYPESGIVPANSTATINVYLRNGNGSIEYKLAQFNLTFIGNSEPVAVTNLVGTTRHPDFLREEYGEPVAELTFDNKTNNEYGSWYKYPVDYKGASYAFGNMVSGGGHKGSYFASRGEYGLTTESGSSGALGGGSYNYYPVNNYLRNMGSVDAALSNTKESDSYFLYIDAADQPGKIASIELKDPLCAGSRLFCYGYIGCTSGGTSQNPTSVLINVMGITNDGKEELVYSYCPGIITLRAYSSDNRHIYASALGRGTVYEPHGSQADYWAPWQQIGFSFTINSDVAGRMRGYSVQIVNNAWNSDGADTVLDDFNIFVKPPKGDVDFTTPLCSDQIRHAKIHADFNMLKEVSGVNETLPGAKMNVSCCFLEADVFDSYTENGLTIGGKNGIFVVDSRGNHNLKPEYSIDDDNVKDLINKAFRAALVGRPCDKTGSIDHGFHSFDISLDYESIPVYSYNDSKSETIYREEVDGVRRIVFKEDIKRGEMSQVDDGNGHKFWPYMRPSKEYYLVFSTRKITSGDITGNTVATNVFTMHESCSFLGKFTTKDPLHVILDNADIEADLPIRAVCHGETTAFYFDIPALKADKPIVDKENCISDEDLNNKVVPESQGVHHYRYEVSFKDDAISGVIKNLPYDWWMGGKLEERTYRGTIEEYQEATHPSIVYNHDTADPSHTHTHDADYKKHGEPVNIALAMEDFRFFYPDFGKDKFDPATGKNNISDAEWGTLLVHDYDNDSGYSLLQSEINTIKSFVNAGIIVLHRNTYDMPLTYEEAEELQDKEMSNMMEKEMNDQILELALTLNTDPSVAALLPLKGLEGTVLDKLSIDGKKRLTFEEFGNFTRDQLVDIASDLKAQKGLLTGVTPEQINTMSDGELRKVVEAELRDMPDDEMLEFAKDYFPNIGHEKRAYLVVRALNILSRETVAALSPADQQNSAATRLALRDQMISIFSAQQELVLRKMWSDVSAKLTEEERTELLKDALHPETPKDPATMNAAALAVLVEDGLAQLTNNVINDLRGDRYVHFTLVPIMPSQVNFVDEPYIFCPEPRGVKLRITSHEPKMIDGFADMDYPQDMENVPVRIGLPQIKETRASAEKTLRIPVRGLKPATKNGVKAVKLAENTGYGKNIFLAETDDPKYQQTKTQGMAEAKKDMGAYTQLVGTVESMIANYPTAENRTPDNFIVVKFNEGMKFREGYTYRVGINYMENDINDDPTISCFGTMLFDMKIVPEYQKWTAAVGNSDWTNDENWARADRDELNAGKQAAGDKIDALATALDDAVSYISNEDNETSTSFVPMYFTNVLLDNNATMAAVLYTEKESQEAKAYKPASRSEKTFLEGLHSTATENIIYEMEVAPSTGAWHDNENYECGLFGTYVANGITFKPAAQLGNAHFLAYNKAWVEYELDADRWYTLGSPLKASVAGDWYSPTEGGKQMTPHFYDINYDPAKNDRFRPAYYQRSWDRGGNNVVYEKSGDTYDSYVKADWSFVYNDAAVDYSAGGFSVKPDIEFMEEGDRPDDGKVLVRLPKADKAYKYYDIDGNIGDADDAVIVDDEQATRADRGSNRLLSDDLRADGSGSITMSVSNQTADNNYLLLSNPFMAAMDMDEFFNANEDLEKKYWIMVAGEQNVSVKTDDGWITTGDAGGKYVAPLQGFFVKTKDGAANKNSILASYTAAMQTVITSSPTNENGAPVLQARTRGGNAEASNIIRLTAERNGATSTAMIVLSGNAKDEYVATEDCETFIDGNIYDNPTVYTSSGSVAQTINVRKSLDMVPVGMVSSDDSETTLRFDLSAAQIGGSKLYLYDGETDSYTEIEDGAEVAMSGNTAGRYFLTTSMEDVNDALRNDTVKKGVWTISGVFCGESIEGLMPGVYVVDGVKMYVR